MTLVRRETKRGHNYVLDGKPVKGVTTLLSGGLPKPQLTYWAARSVAEWVADNEDSVAHLRTMGRSPMISALKSTPWEVRDVAAARGTEVHALAEQIIHGHEVEVPMMLADYVQGYVNFLDTWQAQPIITERPCASRKWWYAGTFDAALLLPSGERLLVDWKTSKSVHADAAIQLAAYRGSDFYLAEDGTEQPMPEVDGLAIVHITPNGTDLYRVADPDAAWRDWLHIAWVAKAADRIKSQIGDPSQPPEVEA